MAFEISTLVFLPLQEDTLTVAFVSYSILMRELIFVNYNIDSHSFSCSTLFVASLAKALNWGQRFSFRS